MRYTNLLIKPVSGNCNMQCEYCFYCDEANKRTQESYGSMSERTLKNAIRKGVLSATEGCTIGFQGGEPTLRGLDFFEQAVEFAKHYNKHHIPISFTLQTNGYELSREFCEFFKENQFLIGLSVDGSASTHDAYRHTQNGAPTYEQVKKTAHLLQEYDIDFNILTVVHKETAEHIQEIYREYKKENWRYLQFIACLDPLFEEQGQHAYSLTPEAYGEFLCQLFQLWYEDYKKGEQPYIRQFENYIGLLAGYYPESCEQIGICGIQHVVEADGGVYPCDFYVLDGYCLGNLNDTSMKVLQEKRQELGFIERSKNHSESCLACKWFPICRGGCNRHRLASGENYFCQSYLRFFEVCYSRMEEIARTLVEH